MILLRENEKAIVNNNKSNLLFSFIYEQFLLANPKELH